MEILDLRGIDPALDKPARLNVWRPRRRPTRTEGEVFHEALPAAAAAGFALPEVSESIVRITLATLATLASITVLALTLTQLLTSDGTRAETQGGGQVQTAETSTPTTEPSAATRESAGSTAAQAGNAQAGQGSGGGTPGANGSINTDPASQGCLTLFGYVTCHDVYVDPLKSPPAAGSITNSVTPPVGVTLP